MTYALSGKALKKTVLKGLHDTEDERGGRKSGDQCSKQQISALFH